jgi:hypothetical protein
MCCDFEGGDGKDRGKMKYSPICSACRDEMHWGPDSQPPVQRHTCFLKGPKTRYAIFKMLVEVSHDLYFSFSASMPGGNYTAEHERDHLLYRLALLIEEKTKCTKPS